MQINLHKKFKNCAYFFEFRFLCSKCMNHIQSQVFKYHNKRKQFSFLCHISCFIIDPFYFKNEVTNPKIIFVFRYEKITNGTDVIPD